MRNVLIAAVLTIVTVPAVASADRRGTPQRNAADYVWVQGERLQDGTQMEGFYRLRHRSGMTWSNGHFNGTVWVNAGWRPINNQFTAGHTVSPGYRGSDGYWVCDIPYQQPRPISNPYSPQYGQPSNSVWVAGYYDSYNNWVAGFWRPISKPGYRWQNGAWQYGVWQAGHWVPKRQRPNSTWSAGYYNGNTWVSGTWRPEARAGYHWVGGHHGQNGWVQGNWSRAKPKGQRSWNRKQHRVNVQRQTRRQQRERQQHRVYVQGHTQRPQHRVNAQRSQRDRKPVRAQHKQRQRPSKRYR